jgi:hypothetical protein
VEMESVIWGRLLKPVLTIAESLRPATPIPSATEHLREEAPVTNAPAATGYATRMSNFFRSMRVLKTAPDRDFGGPVGQAGCHGFFMASH